MAAFTEAGLVLEWQELPGPCGGKRVVVHDTSLEACGIRNRGGEALAQLLVADDTIRALDIRASNISDDGVGHLCLAARKTDQLEELCLSAVGHAGLEYLLGLVQRSTRLHTVVCAQICDVPTLHVDRQNLTAADYDTSSYVKPEPKEGEEEEEEEAEAESAQPDAGLDEEEDEETKELRKQDAIRAVFAVNDYDSGDEGGAGYTTGGVAGANTASRPCTKSATASFARIMADFVDAVRRKDNLTTVECAGDAIPPDLAVDLQRAVEAHRANQEQKRREHEEKCTRTAYGALKTQMQELCAPDEGSPGEVAATRLGMRSFVSRRLFAAVGEALFECQRFKSKENEAVATAEGEMAFIAMYLRKHARAGTG